MKHILKKILKLPDEILDNILETINECYYCKKKLLQKCFCKICLQKWEDKLYFNYLKNKS